MNREKQISEIIASAEELSIDIISIQEHRLYHNDVNIKQHDLPGKWTLLTSSAWKNSMNSTIGGVGILLSPHAFSCLTSIEKISSRIVIANFSGNPSTTIISCYSPTNVADENDVIHFYEQLSSLVRYIPKHNVTIISGDFNAHLGQNEKSPFTMYKESNRNGEHLEKFLLENGMYCLNSRFRKKEGKLWTHCHPNGSKSQIDFLLLNKKWINSALNCEAYNTFEGVSTDHRIVSGTFQLSLRATKKKSLATPPFDWKQMKYDNHLKERFCLTLNNRFEALINETVSPTTDQQYTAFVKAHKEAATEHMPLKPKVKQRIPWECNKISEARLRLKKIAMTKNKNPSRSNITKYNAAKRTLDAAYQEEQQNYLNMQIDTLQSAADNQKASVAWKIVNDISGKKKSSKARIKASSQEDRMNKWKEHFKQLLGNVPTIKKEPTTPIVNYELPIKTGYFTMEELENVLKSTKNSKAAGIDEIPPEVWKTGEFNNTLLSFCNDVYAQKPIRKWTKGCILPFPKKGNLTDPANYRGITLTCIAAKIYNAMLRNRIQPELEKVLRINQNGFRPNRSTQG